MRDLPLAEVAPAPGTITTVAVLLTGDGGWVDVDKALARGLAAHGVAVLALNSRRYLSHRRTPDVAAADVARVARSALARWGEHPLVLVGYSRGADLLPFIVRRLPADLQARIQLVAMLGLSTTANFGFHWTDLVRNKHRPSDLLVLPELGALHDVRLLCVYGTEEADSGCRAADSTRVVRVARPGGHHFDRDYRALADLVAHAATP